MSFKVDASFKLWPLLNDLVLYTLPSERICGICQNHLKRWSKWCGKFIFYCIYIRQSYFTVGPLSESVNFTSSAWLEDSKRWVKKSLMTIPIDKQGTKPVFWQLQIHHTDWFAGAEWRSQISRHIFSWVDWGIHLVIAFCFLKQEVPLSVAQGRAAYDHASLSIAYHIRSHDTLYF